jgi:hypothetical protein
MANEQTHSSLLANVTATLTVLGALGALYLPVLLG